MDGLLFLVVWGIIVFAIRGAKRGAKGQNRTADNSAAQRTAASYQVSRTTNRTTATRSSVQNASNATVKSLRNLGRASAKAFESMSYHATHADQEYDEELMDYCDSELSPTRGITFRDVPAGTDELLYLRRYNYRREKELERALQSRQD